MGEKSIFVSFFVALSSGPMNIIKLLHCPLTKQCCCCLSLGHRGKKFCRERRESNPGLLGAKRERYPLCYAAPLLSNAIDKPLCLVAISSDDFQLRYGLSPFFKIIGIF